MGFVSELIHLEDHVIDVIFWRIEVDSWSDDLNRCIEFIWLRFVASNVGVGHEIIVSFVELHVIGYSMMKIRGSLPCSLLIFLHVFAVFIVMIIS